MIEEEGIVIQTFDDKAKVKTIRSSACEGCASASFCHPEKGTEMIMEVVNNIHAKVGERVKIGLKPGVYLKASFLVYMVPIIIFIIGAIIGKELAVYISYSKDSDLFAIITGVILLIPTFIAMRLYNRKIEKDRTYQPVILEVM
ncbi:MAG: SoxR reducing system RseC family protein [Nitrospirae bacterium]|nr:SoxR reducing system RseC family protein [Nitrospirota bacterium]